MSGCLDGKFGGQFLEKNQPNNLLGCPVGFVRINGDRINGL